MLDLTTEEFGSPIYQDAARYDAEHWWKLDDIAFWREMAHSYGPKVLELAAGTGRLARPVLEAGCHYTGVEISDGFVERAKFKLGQYGDRAVMIEGDIRTIKLGETFDLIFIGFNSFLHLLTDDDAKAALKTIQMHSHESTHFIIDIFVPNPLFLYRPEGHRVQNMTFPDPVKQTSVNVEETNSYDAETGLNRITWYYSTEEEIDFLVYDFTVRMYFPDTMDRLLHDAGYRIVHKWGDYDQRPQDAESHLQIYVAQPAPK